MKIIYTFNRDTFIKLNPHFNIIITEEIIEKIKEYKLYNDPDLFFNFIGINVYFYYSFSVKTYLAYNKFEEGAKTLNINDFI